MSSRRPGTLSQAWFRWKALRLPWRRRWLVGKSLSLGSIIVLKLRHRRKPLTRPSPVPGFDLEGNTYWEFRPRGVERLRRIVDHPRSTHYSDVHVTPLWHQWLRYTREQPPSIEEQQNEVIRQARMKHLASAADARWEAKPRLTDAPGAATGQRAPTLGSAEHTKEASKGPVAEKGVNVEGAQEKADAADPWAKAKAQSPGEKWQPTAWDPTGSKKS